MALLLIIIVALLVSLVATSRHIIWSAIPQYIFDETILDGIKLTILFTVLSMVISIIAGAILAMMRLSPNPVLSAFASLYIWFFRGTPLLVQIIFWFNIQLFIPSIDIGSFHVDTNSIITAFIAALLALSLNEAAYMAEIIRGGLMAVDSGQHEAAKALGYTPGQAMLRIIFPQALRVIIPPIGNQTISMLKTTSLVSIVAAQDLLTRAQNIYARNFLIIELLIVASIWYLVMTTIASAIQFIVEQRLGKSTNQTPGFVTNALRLMRAEGRNG
nr:amino acid ABC transporter permease [Arboricoccus pini]